MLLHNEMEDEVLLLSRFCVWRRQNSLSTVWELNKSTEEDQNFMTVSW